MGCVYGLREKGAAEYMYVGCTARSAHIRIQSHFSPSSHPRDSAIRKWISSTPPHNIVGVVLEDCADSQVFAAEAKWIRRLRADGHKLLNKDKLERAMAAIEAERV